MRSGRIRKASRTKWRKPIDRYPRFGCLVCIRTTSGNGTFGLLMPTRFWPTAVPRQKPRSAVVEGPQSSANLVPEQNMVNVWSRQFTVANVLVIVGFGLLAAARGRLRGTAHGTKYR
jgi:hypothetical protein